MGTMLDNQKLTNKQEEIVNYEGDELLIRGLAGSGKTTVLLSKARKTIRKDSSIRIGLFTYNKTLRNYANVFAEKIGPDNLKVNTFHGWAYHVLRDILKKRPFVVYGKQQKELLFEVVENLKKVSNHRFVNDKKYEEFLAEEISWIKGKIIKDISSYENVSRIGRGSSVRVTRADRRVIFNIYKEYEELKDRSKKIDYDDYAVLLWKNKEKIRDTFKFDYVMVDEGQDLQQVQLMLLRYIAKDKFIIAADKGQKIYKTSFSWKEIGINILGGRTKILENTFRSTKQIIQMAHSLQLNDSIVKDEEYVRPILPEYTGPIPEVFECNGKSIQDTAIIETIKKLLEDENITIGVLARGWRSINRLYYSLQAEGIPHEYVKQDKGNVHSPGVKLTSFHSAKGLEFDYVIIMDLVQSDEGEPLGEELEVERRLLYVSLTRAKKHLQVYYYEKPSLFLKEIDSSYYKNQLI